MELEKEKLRNLYEIMVEIRKFDEKAEKLFRQGKIPGFIHSYVGEEAIASGVMENLKEDDYITSTHRGHGHTIAKGGDMKKMMAELFGKKTGYNKGKGGSMHIANTDIGMLGANGEVAGGIPIAVGAGLAIKYQSTDQVVVSFFGDGATNRGAFHEGLNFAAIYNLPIIFVNEFNEYASTAAAEEMVSVNNTALRSTSYGIPGVTIDGNDVFEVYETTKKAIERARFGGGPFYIEAKTYRLKGHFVGDPGQYRDEEEVEEFWEQEPIQRFENKILEEDFSEEDLKKIKDDIDEKLQEAIEYAEESEFPEPEEALEDLFAKDEGYEY